MLNPSLEAGREAYARQAWREAWEALSSADATEQLAGDDLELLARSAYLLGKDDHYLDGLERAHRAHLEAGDLAQAVRCTFWIGHHLLFRRQAGPAHGWFARGRRILEDVADDSVERGWMLVAEVLDHVIAGDPAGAERTAAAVVDCAQRFGDRELLALGVMEQGHAMVRQGRRDEGFALVDEAMVAVTAGDLTAVVAGIVYCNTLSFCRGQFDLRRAREWTMALDRWCGEQPEMIAHNGPCRVHRAELLTLEGAWGDARDELRRLQARYTDGVLNELVRGEASYQQAELCRLLGELDDADDLYSRANEQGRTPMPGLAQLQLARGDVAGAATAVRRAVTETTGSLRRAALLPAFVEVMLAVDDLEAARGAARELARTAEDRPTRTLVAMAADARGNVALEEGDADGALVDLRSALTEWQELQARYPAARTRVRFALACRAVGDEDGADRELSAARSALAELGAVTDLAWMEQLTGSTDRPHGLTPREIEVLALVARGRSNREIAEQLVISEHTVARHLQNIFRKIAVSSRTAASAWAFEHGVGG